MPDLPPIALLRGVHEGTAGGHGRKQGGHRQGSCLTTERGPVTGGEIGVGPHGTR